MIPQIKKKNKFGHSKNCEGSSAHKSTNAPAFLVRNYHITTKKINLKR